MATHQHVERNLSAYLDREVSLADEQALRSHLDQCASCREELTRLRQTKQLLASLPERELPDFFWADISRRLRADAPAQTGPLPWLRGVTARPAVAVAAVLVILLVALLPLVRGQIGRLRAAEFGFDLLVREHAIAAVGDRLADRAHLGFIITEANLAIIGSRRGEPRR